MLLLLCTGCATVVVPGVRLDTPEGRAGEAGRGRLEAVGLQTGTSLSGATTTDTEGNLFYPRSVMSPFLGFSVALTSRSELGVRLQPYAPIQVRYKHQVYGASEGEDWNPEWAAERRFSIALSGSAGGMLITGGGTYILGDGALILGVRPWEQHLFLLSPFAGMFSVNGPLTASGTQFGVAAGYQYTVESWFSRLEVSWSTGSAGGVGMRGFSVGMMTGLNWGN